MTRRRTFSSSNPLRNNETLQSPRRRTPAERPGSDSDTNSSYHNSRITREDTSDSSSEEGLGAFFRTRSRESDFNASSNDPHPSLDRRINRMGGLGRAAQEMFSSRDERVTERAEQRAESDRADLARRMEQAQGPRRRGPITRDEDRIEEHEIRTGNYAYHAQVDGNGRLRRLSEVEGNGRAHRLSLRTLGRENGNRSSAFSDTDSDEPTAPRDYGGRGINARGEDYDHGPSTSRSYSSWGIGARRDEYDDDYEGRSTPRGFGGRRWSSRRDHDEDEY